MTQSKIEWTERSDWNPIRGCTRVSPGCGGPGPHGGCYAEAIAARFSDTGQAFHGFATRTPAGGRWTGKVEVQWDRLELPLSWRKPAVIFANSTSDVFHEALALDEVASIYGVAVAAYHLRGHTTQIVTKRPDRARELLNSEKFWEVVNAEAGHHVMERVDPLNRRSDDARATLDEYGPENPPPGVWIGVSVENQEWADKRREDTRAIPAVVRFVSYEPALGPVDWAGWEFLDWIISGGESGPRARPNHPDWHRGTRDFCGFHGISYLMKQWGEWRQANEDEIPERFGPACDSFRVMCSNGFVGDLSLESAFPHKPARYPDCFPMGADGDSSCNVVTMIRVGKKAAGRLLDGVEHNGFPA